MQSKSMGYINRYADTSADMKVINKLADECYLPANKILLEQIQTAKGQFKVNFSLSGTMLQLLTNYRPEVIESFRVLIATGCVEILAETFYHSLSSLHSTPEFSRQVAMHRNLVSELFGLEPAVFRNTELIHNNSMAHIIKEMGLAGILCEGSERLLNGRSANHIYSTPGNTTPLLLRNSRLSDDIAFRFDDSNWSEHPLTAGKFAEWIHSHPEVDEVINLFMDYETFGIHKPAGSGIFEFLQNLPGKVLANKRFAFSTATDAINNFSAKDIYDAPRTISWNDKNKECCVLCENVMQNNMLKKIYSLQKMVLKNGDQQLIELWGLLQTADYFYYMSDTRCRDNDHSYLNPFNSPEDAYRNYTAIVTDFELLLIQKGLSAFNYSHYDSPAGMLY